MNPLDPTGVLAAQRARELHRAADQWRLAKLATCCRTATSRAARGVAAWLAGLRPQRPSGPACATC